MTRQLKALGNAVMQAVESSVGVGMMGMSWQREQLQNLFEEVHQQHDIEYIYLVDRTGRIVVSGQAGETETVLPGPPIVFASLRTDRVASGVVQRAGKNQAFEIRKRFALSTSSHMRMMQRMMGGMGMMYGPDSSDYAFILGLSMTDYENARREDTRRAVGSAGILAIIALSSTFFAAVIQKYYAANRALKDAESFTRHVIEGMGHGLIALNQQGNIETINRKACELLRLDESDALECPFIDVMAHVQCSIDKQDLRQKEWREKKVRCILKDHQTRSLSLTTSHIRGEEDEPLGTVILMRDLHEIEALQEKLKRSERLASLGQMAAGIAHEVRNPLGSIKGLAQYFARKFENQPEEKKYAEAIIGESDRLNRVVRDLLDFARPQEPEYQICSNLDIIDHALALVQADLQAKQITFTRHCDNKVSSLKADPDLLAQALMNLFLNAVEAMDANGTLSVNCVYHENDQKIQVEIKDNGSGVAPEDLPKIFDPFFTGKKGGTGLGLALVHRIVENHGGSIDVHSQVGRGTTFTILLPIKP